jgi:hypothetical protein
MLMRRAILGVLASVLAVLFVQRVALSTSAEDKEPGPAKSENPSQSDVQAEGDALSRPEADIETIEIPLSEIWALHMPGMRDVQELEKGKPSNKRMMRDFGKALDLQPKDGVAKPAFAVVGTGFEALREARDIMLGRRKPPKVLPADKELSVVFSSHEFGYYVHIHEVFIRDSSVTIKYRFVPHRTKELTRHFALIPIGKQPPGTVSVNIICSPMQQEFLDAGFQSPDPDAESRVISGSFEFQVVESN